MPYSAIKVANRFRELSGGTLTPLQLIKLVYIAHGWSFAKRGEPLINEDVEAWQYGPVVPSLYRAISHFRASPVNAPITGDYDSKRIDAGALELIDAIYTTYGRFSGGQLSSLTHRPNSPWSQVWRTGGRNEIIPPEIIAEHYRALEAAGKTNL